jgi:hypothetical protein
MRIEVWDDVECNSGVRLGFISRDDLFSAQESLEVSGAEELTISFVSDIPAWQYIAHKNVLRPVFNNDDFREYRIFEISGTRGQSGGIVRQVVAHGIRNDLQYNTRMLEFEQADGSVFLHEEHIDILPDDAVDIVVGTGVLPAYITKGTIEPTTRIDMVMDWETPLSALEEIAKISRGELNIRRNGATDYKIDILTKFNSAAEKPVIQFKKNELTAQMSEDMTQMGTRVYPKGEGPQGDAPNIGDVRLAASVIGGAPPIATWRVSHLYGSDQMFTSEADQFNDLWVQYDEPPQYVQITDSASQPATYPHNYCDLTLASAVTLASPIFIREDNAGKEMVSLISPSGMNDYGEVSYYLERYDFPGVVNVAGDPFFDASDSWEEAADSAGTPTITQVGRPSPYIKYGDYAIRVQGDTGDLVEWDGFSALRSANINAQHPNLSFQLFGHIETGRIEFYAEFVDDTGNFTFDRFPRLDLEGNYQTETDGTPILSQTIAIGSAFHLRLQPQKINFDEYISGIGTSYNPPHSSATMDRVRLYVKILEDSTDVYLDAVQIVNRTVAGEKIVKGSSLSKLWNAAIMAFIEGIAEPKMTVDATAIDIERLDPTTYPYDAFDRGVTCILRDPGLDIDVERRIFSVKRDLLREGITQLEIVEP